MIIIQLLTTFVLFFSIAPLMAQVSLTIDVTNERIPMSQDLIGVFFEDINYGADGGLYAEMVQNRSFEYYVVDGYTSEGPLEAWTAVQTGGASVTLSVENTTPLNQNNTNYLKMIINSPGTAAGIMNTGFNGMNFTRNEKYNFSVYLKRTSDFNEPIIVQLKNTAGGILGADTIHITTDQWKQYTLELGCKLTTSGASLHILPSGNDTVYLDMVSLFPQNTFKNRENGLRNDLAQAIADLKPQFLRFPGGCISHGRGLDNAYRWKNTVGNVAERKPNWNLWGYHQTYGLGFYEFFLFCEDMGAKPLPVLPVGISCQFRTREIAPLAEMQSWIDDAVDLVEFANGDTTTEWGGLRASMGHPEPFNLEYICLGNEEDDIAEFRERFTMIADSVRKHWPDIKIIGTSGTDDTGSYYSSLWEFSRESNLDAVDEHYYNSPDWFLNNIHRYDNFDRNGPKVFIGEYASQDDLLYNAIAEAAYLTGVEKNADIIELTCYAPLLCNENNNQWNPDLIRFDNSNVIKTASYYVQQLYSVNAGDNYIPSEVTYVSGYNTNEDEFTGMVGVGTWNTQAQFDDLTIVSGNTTLFEDNFVSGSSNWVISSGTFTTTDGVYSQTASTEPAVSIYQHTIDSTEYTLTIKAKKTGGYEGFLIPFGYKDANNYYWLNIAGWSNSQHAIEKVTDGTKSVLFATTGSINSNQWYEIRIVVTKDDVKCYLDTTLLFDMPVNPGPFTASVTEDIEANDLILKMVNSGSTAITASVNIAGMTVNQTVPVTVLTGNKSSRNSLASPELIKPTVSNVTINNAFEYTLPAYSFHIVRINKGDSTAIKNAGNKKDKSAIRIIPNPVKRNIAHIYFDRSDSEPFNLCLYDTQGKLILHKSNLTDNYISINTAHLPAATYLICLQYEGKSYTENMVLN